MPSIANMYIANKLAQKYIKLNIRHTIHQLTQVGLVGSLVHLDGDGDELPLQLLGNPGLYLGELLVVVDQVLAVPFLPIGLHLVHGDDCLLSVEVSDVA